MNFKKYLMDKLLYILFFYINIIVVILVMHLSLTISLGLYPMENISYAFILSTVFLILFLIIDYSRKRPFYKSLNNIKSSSNGIENMLGVGEIRSREHLIYRDILFNNYKYYKDYLDKYEENQRQYIYFTNQWVHQMKTPVSVINLLLQDKNTKNFNEVLQSIEEENEKLSQGLEMMLYNTRLSQFNLDFKVEQVDVLNIVREVINDHKKLLIKYSIFPKLEGEKELIVETDRKWLRFVINQILNNAMKYSKDINKDNKSIIIKAKKEHNRYIISIMDEGIGIPQQDLRRVFDPFFTGENGRKFSESTGMGMYLAKKICSNLGHRITVESEEGKWTQFSIIFYSGGSIFKM